MTIGIRYASRSDVGMLREGNEDSAYAGPRLLAVADGMGGHAGGEVASAAAIEVLRRLDIALPEEQLLPSLEQAAREANDALRGIVESEPALQGMGTTLTAMLWSGSKLALVQIGDSRAYLLRKGDLYQITRDQTLVQMLLDDGKLTPDQVATYPYRSMLLQALDGRPAVEPDLQLRSARIGDRYLLCSDGLWGLVDAQTIHHTLSTIPDLEQSVQHLIALANEAGGSDNITCIVADVVELDDQSAPATPPILAGAAQSQTPHLRNTPESPGPTQPDTVRPSN